jgi:hypothetical protein
MLLYPIISYPIILSQSKMTEHIAGLEEELVKANERTEAKQLELDAANEEFKQYQVGR